MVSDLLAGRMRSGDAQGEAYRLLLVAACNAYHESMPFMFEPIGDVTELLMPADLLSPNSVFAAAREALTVEACRDVEVIGWLYQFYIAEKKEEVDAKVKKGGKVAPDELPAKTSLYTPHWIVRYLVENSLGRLWLLNRPGSRLAEKMPYYIKPEEPESDFLRAGSPEDLTVADTACGSGHILTYAFDLLYLIYEEEGYNPPDIPRLILEKNLFGMEIDPRSAALAAFALVMKARARDRRFLRRGVTPHICAYAPATVTEAELRETAWFKALSTSLIDLPMRDALLHDLGQWEQIANIGSLLQPQLTMEQIETLQDRIGGAGYLLDELANERVLSVLEQLAYLARKYHVVVANPPYMGSSIMNAELSIFLSENYETVKSDLFAAFIVRNLELTLAKGQLGFMSPFVWMFISSYEKLREFLIAKKTITSLVQLEYSGFAGATVPICTFTVENAHRPDFKGGYVRLSAFRGPDNQGPKTLEAIRNSDCGWFYRASAADFKKIPGMPIAYWVSQRIFKMLGTSLTLGSIADARMGMATGNNERFVRLWHECVVSNIGFSFPTREAANKSKLRWFPYCKGGVFRKWYGNNEYVVDWHDDGRELQTTKYPSGTRIWAHNFNLDYIFRDSITWSDITSGLLSVRHNDRGFLFDGSGTCAFFQSELDKATVLGLLNTTFIRDFSKVLNPTLHFQTGDFRNIPYRSELGTTQFQRNVTALVQVAKCDWDSYETSWGFRGSPLLPDEHRSCRVAATYQAMCSHHRNLTLKVQHLEEENNQIFMEAYDLQNELTPDVPLSEITLTCNPHYRYRGKKSEAELEELLRADTMREFISYAVGCMFGRYSLDKPGLLLSNQGETVEDYLRQVPEPTFMPDRDNVLPMLDGEWFTDDIAARFGRFLRVTFGDEHYPENLAFIEQAIGRDIRSFFVREFYDDHLKRYQHRPIYWLFSSPGGSFNALVYMHRYRPDTVSVVLNDYLREYQAKLAAARADALHNSIAAGASNREKTAALKELARLDKVLKELAEYETVLLELARKQVVIDLDDGVKVNYARLGPALRRVVGLNA
jgi:type II restriction/modification system DNA methylase subunit YeeA